MSGESKVEEREGLGGLTQSELWELKLKLAGIELTEGQKPIVNCEKRFVLVAGGEQSGKSVAGAAYLLAREGQIPDEGELYWLVGSDYAGTRREFDYLAEGFGKMGKLKAASTRVDPGHIELYGSGEKPGTRIETKSALDYRMLRAYGPHGIVVCEAGTLDLEAYRRIDSRVAPKRGWLFMSGTFEGSLGWYPGLFSQWEWGTGDAQAFSLPTWSNTHLYPGGRNDPEILRLEAAQDEQWFMERIAGRPCPPRGLVLPEFNAVVHIREVEWEPEERVYIWEDPGYGSESAHAVEVAQIIKGQVQIFDEIYERGLIQSEIISICQKRPWWKATKVLVSDPSYKTQHHSMPAVSEIWMEEAGLYAGGEKVREEEGIHTLRGFLKVDHRGVPGLVISPKCRGILSEVGASAHPIKPYEGQTRVWQWKMDRDGNIVGDKPENKNNHGCKAVIFGLVEHFGYAKSNLKDILVEVHRY